LALNPRKFNSLSFSDKLFEAGLDAHLADLQRPERGYSLKGLDRVFPGQLIMRTHRRTKKFEKAPLDALGDERFLAGAHVS